ncbi:PIG-L family deacetylase [Paenibacillus sp.]|uniref:PIG-L deacetylase family protein n=1 Tax=Paenibacillus sp. TaxID=58172 RepID=UPI002D2599C0|nr:PIG-L family deacetylase [Paenibacillus sp.]HZG87400.1 PIG-L family deacetylase [Paenibacillus sp.]
MSVVLVVAPHPDDETLGCGGTLLRHKEQGDEVHWLIVTSMSEQYGFTKERMEEREAEIQRTKDAYGFDGVTQLQFPTMRLDDIPMADLVARMSASFQEIRPNTVYVPHRGDVHTDHAAVFDATISCTKWFRYPFVSKIAVYETLSETDFGLNPDNNGFRPNWFVDIAPWIDRKIEIMNIFRSEMGAFPFPRSEEAIRSLAKVRGAASGFEAAEAFMVLKETWGR